MAGEVSLGHAKSAGIVSIFILIFAVVNLITGFVFVSYGSKDATGIWIGLLLAVAGILGILVWVKKSKTIMIFFLVLCIIDIITCIVQAALAAIAFLIWQILKGYIDTKCKRVGDHCECPGENVPIRLEDCSWISAVEAIFLVILIVNGLATIFVFAGSIIGCMATCCASSPPPQQAGVVIVQQPAQMQPYPPSGAMYQPPGYQDVAITQKS